MNGIAPAIVLLLCGIAPCLAKQTPAPGGATGAGETAPPAESRYMAARTAIGGSIAIPLVKKCNSVRDFKKRNGDVNPEDRHIKEKILIQLAGKIGPVKYEKRTTRTERPAEISIKTESACDGSNRRTRARIARSRRNTDVHYRTAVPAGFDKAFEEMKILADENDAAACAEYAACIFLDVFKGKMGMYDEAALEWFEKAANAGSDEGKFMYAFCMYYGIGNSGRQNRKKAYETLREMANAPQASEEPEGIRKLFTRGWAARRLDEAFRETGAPNPFLSVKSK
ncbi:MAG: sel1 repeat family protein [Kiritimatiellae bacterium]|nr:sel1 repeat family protein [Kiritimatiellia bacterium]